MPLPQIIVGLIKTAGGYYSIPTDLLRVFFYESMTILMSFHAILEHSTTQFDLPPNCRDYILGNQTTPFYYFQYPLCPLHSDQCVGANSGALRTGSAKYHIKILINFELYYSIMLQPENEVKFITKFKTKGRGCGHILATPTFALWDVVNLLDASRNQKRKRRICRSRYKKRETFS